MFCCVENFTVQRTNDLLNWSIQEKQQIEQSQKKIANLNSKMMLQYKLTSSMKRYLKMTVFGFSHLQTMFAKKKKTKFSMTSSIILIGFIRHCNVRVVEFINIKVACSYIIIEVVNYLKFLYTKSSMFLYHHRSSELF